MRAVPARGALNEDSRLPSQRGSRMASIDGIAGARLFYSDQVNVLRQLLRTLEPNVVDIFELNVSICIDIVTTINRSCVETFVQDVRSSCALDWYMLKPVPVRVCFYQ